MKKRKLEKPSVELFNEFATTESYVGHGTKLKCCLTCGGPLWVTSQIAGYDPVTREKDIYYTYACDNVLKEGKKYLALSPWKRLFTARPWHQIGCEDFGG